MKASNLTIGALSRLTETKVETIRFYEKTGLLPEPDRTAGNYRSYDRDHLNRLSFIRRARGLGFSLDQIRELLRLSDDRDHSCDQVDAMTRAHLIEVERKMVDLAAMRAELARMLEQCSCGTVAQCHIIETLSPAPEDIRRLFAAE